MEEFGGRAARSMTVRKSVEYRSSASNRLSPATSQKFCELIDPGSIGSENAKATVARGLMLTAPLPGVTASTANARRAMGEPAPLVPPIWPLIAEAVRVTWGLGRAFGEEPGEQGLAALQTENGMLSVSVGGAAAGLIFKTANGSVSTSTIAAVPEKRQLSGVHAGFRGLDPLATSTPSE
jgi:hypothetical protein